MASSHDKDTSMQAALSMLKEPNPNLLSLFDKYPNRSRHFRTDECYISPIGVLQGEKTAIQHR